MHTATLFITSASAAQAGETFLTAAKAGYVQITKVVRRNIDSKEVERGYVARVQTETLAFYL